MASYMPPLHVPLETKWKHWPTYIYDKNYGYGINYYQPMLDHIDREGRPSSLPRYYTRSEPPELPWSDGRLLWEDKPVEPYSRHELIKRAIDAEDEARDHLTHFKVRIEEIGERKSGQSRERGKAVRRLHDCLWPFPSLNLAPRKGLFQYGRSLYENGCLARLLSAFGRIFVGRMYERIREECHNRSENRSYYFDNFEIYLKICLSL